MVQVFVCVGVEEFWLVVGGIVYCGGEDVYCYDVVECLCFIDWFFCGFCGQGFQLLVYLVDQVGGVEVGWMQL